MYRPWVWCKICKSLRGYWAQSGILKTHLLTFFRTWAISHCSQQEPITRYLQSWTVQSERKSCSNIATWLSVNIEGRGGWNKEAHQLGAEQTWMHWTARGVFAEDQRHPPSIFQIDNRQYIQWRNDQNQIILPTRAWKRHTETAFFLTHALAPRSRSSTYHFYVTLPLAQKPPIAASTFKQCFAQRICRAKSMEYDNRIFLIVEHVASVWHQEQV